MHSRCVMTTSYTLPYESPPSRHGKGKEGVRGDRREEGIEWEEGEGRCGTCRRVRNV